MTSWRPASAGEVERGAYGLQPFPPNDVRRAQAVIQRHGDLGVSLADASIVLLAERSGARDVLTLDERHFRTLMAGEEPFRLLPADA